MRRGNVDLLQSWPSWPQYGAREFEAVARVIRSNQLFAAHEVKMFERDFANYQNVDFAVGVGNATEGLHLALAALGIGEGDEVIVTNCSWISTASCILMQNAVPVFVDIESRTLGIDPELIANSITSRTKAIIAVHILGYPAQIDKIRDIAKKFGLFLIEDASHAPGAELNGVKMGTFGDIAVFSLQQRKAISTGDGGVICTNNSNLAEKISRLRSFGDVELSYNYRMTEFSGALARLGLEKLDENNLKREQSAKHLHNLFLSHEWIKVRLVEDNEKGVYYAIAIELNLPDECAIQVLEYFTNLGVPMRKMFSPLNKHPHFSSKKTPARGLPWKNSSYDGEMKNLEYASLDFPLSYEFCYGRILELYAHPQTTSEHLESFAEEMVMLYKNKFDNRSRKFWSVT